MKPVLSVPGCWFPRLFFRERARSWRPVFYGGRRCYPGLFKLMFQSGRGAMAASCRVWRGKCIEQEGDEALAWT